MNKLFHLCCPRETTCPTAPMSLSSKWPSMNHRDLQPSLEWDLWVCLRKPRPAGSGRHVSPPLQLIDENVSCQEKSPLWQAAESRAPGPRGQPYPIPVPSLVPSPVPQLTSSTIPPSPTADSQTVGAPKGPSFRLAFHLPRPATRSSLGTVRRTIHPRPRGWTCQIQ